MTKDKTVTMSRELVQRWVDNTDFFEDLRGKSMAEIDKAKKEDEQITDELRAVLAAPVVERQDGSALMKIAADLANRRPLSRLQRICEGTGKISIDHLSEDVDKCGDLLAGIALDIRQAITSPPAPVVVQLDENVEFEKWWCRTPVLRKGKLQIAQEAWEARACLDKVKEMNQ